MRYTVINFYILLLILILKFCRTTNFCIWIFISRLTWIREVEPRTFAYNVHPRVCPCVELLTVRISREYSSFCQYGAGTPANDYRQKYLHNFFLIIIENKTKKLKKKKKRRKEEEAKAKKAFTLTHRRSAIPHSSSTE